MLRVLTDAEIEESRARDRAMIAALSVADKSRLAGIRYRLQTADDKEALEHLVRQMVNGVLPTSADPKPATDRAAKT